MTETVVGARHGRASPQRSLRVEVLRDVAALERIRAQWLELVRTAREGSAFTGPTFALDWYRSVERRGGVYVIAVWRGEELVGVMPLSLTTVGGFRLFTSMGAEDSYYGDPLLGPDRRAVAESIVDHLCTVAARGLGAFDLRRLLSTGSVLKALRDRPFIDVRRLRAKARSLVRFDEMDDVDKYFRRVARKHQVERRRRRLAEHLGTVEYLPADPEPDQATAAMISMLERRFSAEDDQASPLFVKKAKEFVKSDVFRQLVDTGEARVATLLAGDRRVAVSTDIVAGNRLDAQYAVYEPDLARFGIGNIEIYECLRYAHRRGHAEVDLGSAKFEYKAAWATHTHDLQDVVVTAPAMAGRVAHVMRRVAMSYRARRGVGRQLAQLRLSGERNFG